MITIMGGKFAPKLLSKTTHLVCNNPSECSFYSQAVNYGTKIVSQLWLEQCALQGRLVEEAKYSFFGENVNKDTALRVDLSPTDGLLAEKPESVYVSDLGPPLLLPLPSSPGSPDHPPHVTAAPAGNSVKKEFCAPLVGCTVYCTNVLSSKSSELLTLGKQEKANKGGEGEGKVAMKVGSNAFNFLARELGADFSWEFNDHVTHVLHEQGRGEVNKISAQALKQAKVKG